MKKYKGNHGKHGFQNRDRFEKKQTKALNSVVEKILAALRSEEVHDWGARRLMRKSGVASDDAFFDALRSLKEKRKILMDRQHNVKLV